MNSRNFKYIILPANKKKYIYILPTELIKTCQKEAKMNGTWFESRSLWQKRQHITVERMKADSELHY
jgi:hypothetical protein